MATNEPYGRLTFKCIIDYWGMRFDTKLFYRMPCAILSFNVAHMTTRRFSSHNCVTNK